MEMLKKYALFSLIVLAVFGAGCSAGENETALEEDKDEMQKRLERMVESQIEGRGVTDPAVLAAMRETPRWKFVPEDLKHRAFEDNPLPINLPPGLPDTPGPARTDQGSHSPESVLWAYTSLQRASAPPCASIWTHTTLRSVFNRFVTAQATLPQITIDHTRGIE